MDLHPLSSYEETREAAVARAQFILNTLVGMANGDEEANAGEPVTASKKYFGDDMAVVWRYLVEENVTISVPRNSFFANTQRMQTTVGNQPVAVTFDETTSTITVETNKA